MKENFNPDVYGMSFANGGASYVADPGSAEGAPAAGGTVTDPGAAAAPEGNSGAQASSGAGTGQEPAAWAPVELEYKGQKIPVKTREEAIALMQQGHDYTQKTQSAAKAKQEALKLKQDYMSRLERTTALLAELEAKRNKAATGEGEGEQEGDGEGRKPAPPADDKLQKLERELAELRDERNAEAWEKITAPILQKFPDVPEAELAEAFKAAVDRGEVENSLEGLQEVAEQMNGHYSGEINKRLEKQLATKDSPLVKAHNDRVISEFLNDANNPKLQEFTQKVIADYVAGKLKLKDAAGDTGKGAAAGAGKKERTIAEIAAQHRSAFRED